MTALPYRRLTWRQRCNFRYLISGRLVSGRKLVRITELRAGHMSALVLRRRMQEWAVAQRSDDKIFLIFAKFGKFQSASTELRIIAGLAHGRAETYGDARHGRGVPVRRLRAQFKLYLEGPGD